MKHLKEIMISLYHRKWLKYGIVTIVAILLLGVVGENSLWNVHRNKRRIVELKILTDIIMTRCRYACWTVTLMQ